jgi:L-alanine-DL-glutamate epimerase-like enolase superfamily enzyme
MSALAVDTAVERLAVSAYTVPTDEPESDGTLAWDETTIVVVHAHGGGEVGLGYTYGDISVARFVESALADAVTGRDALDVGACWGAMQERIRNAGRPGLGQMAVAAVDVALWDLKARLLGVPLVVALDASRLSVPVYGSGGFTSYSLERLHRQLGQWASAGIPRVKLKVGRDPGLDPHRLEAARDAVGSDVALLVDANGAFSRKEALGWADRYAAEWDVSWLEEPVSSDDLEGLRLVRDRAPAGMDVAAGEYGDVLPYFERMLAAGAVDCLQGDVTRCGGLTGLLQVGALCAARSLDLSGHCAPQISAHALCAVPRVRHLEYFHDHARVEALLFDDVLEPEDGALRPDRTRPGHGLELRREEVEQWAA